MKSPILSTRAFRYMAEVRKLDSLGSDHSFRIAGAWRGAKDLTAERTTLQMTLDAAGLFALRDLIDAEVKT
jgi:hypothetical protein